MISTLQEMIAGLQQELHTAGRKLQEGETLRRKLHNTVQELKGNIRVFCRVRPMLNGEGGGGGNDLAASHIDIGLDLERQQEEIRLTQWSESAAGNQISKVYPFTFDKVFGPGATQGDVFGEISQLVQSALDGYRVCIFAYGQTGSGKTFTMEGDAGDLERLGMIPRAVEQIFASTELLREKGWSFGFEASYLEIYNETIRDLLAARAAADAECKYDIRHVDGNTTVSELTVVPVSAPSQILDLLRKAAANRAVAETLCNERSSRSHSVFTLRIRGENGVTTEKIEGLLHLVDLAGSERLGQSGSTGERLKETQAINKSLSSLGDVIHAIANREAHVPYRNSKLTFLLQNSLGKRGGVWRISCNDWCGGGVGGNCKTLMFVNISPAPASLGESLCSLRFAAKVNACQIGTASRKVTK